MTSSLSHLKGFKGSLHEGGIRVPAITEWPGKIKPAITDFPASTMDIMPTIVDLLDLEKDPGEKSDISGIHPEEFEVLKAMAEKLTASVQASAEGKDYPEGKVLQPQRGTPWMEMPEYQKLYPNFQKLKPSWDPPRGGKK